MAETAQKLITLAATIVESCLADGENVGGGGKGAASASPKMGARNQVYYASINGDCPKSMVPMLTAMVSGTLKSKSTLLKCARDDGILDLPPSSLPPGCPPLCGGRQRQPPAELLVVLYEALLGSRRVRGTSPIVRLVKGRKASLQKTLAGRRKRGKESAFTERTRLPRFVRVNHIRTKTERAHEHFGRELGLRYQRSPDRTAECGLRGVAKGSYTVDPVLPDVFVLPAGTNLHADRMVNDGALVLQDRSSCMTAIALDPPPGAVCIDTCASPGNKTLHTASLMMKGMRRRGIGGPIGRITAFERDPTRLGTLQRRIVEQGADGFVEARGGDFMDADVGSTDGEFSGVTHVLVDPSCSGSGLAADSATGTAMASEYDRPSGDRLAVAGNTSDSKKVAQLAAAQVEILLHAMRLPNLQVVAYSTCSVFREENEDVVLKVLRRQKVFRCAKAIPGWSHRGLKGVKEFEDIAPLVCRATYEKDGTNGFFVARFERINARDDGAKRVQNKKMVERKEKERERKKREAEAFVAIEQSSSGKQGAKRQKVSLKQDTAIAPIKRESCIQFLKRGKCKRGNRCRFYHETENSSPRDDVDALMEEWA